MASSRAGPATRNTTIAAIAAAERRAILSGVLAGRAGTEPSLAAHLATVLDGRSTSRPGDVDAHRVDLVHVHLPVLANAALVTWDRDAGTVEPRTHPALADPRFRRLLELESRDVDPVLEALAVDQQRYVLSALVAATRPMSRTALARSVLHQEGLTATEPAVETVSLELHHVHLPSLAAADLVAYDAAAGRATPKGRPALIQVFEIIDEPDPHVLERYDAFLGGLTESVGRGGELPGERDRWPDTWGEPHRG